MAPFFGVSTAITDGVKVSVESHYLPDQSAPALGRFAFAYKVRIENDGASGVQLLSRHWIITDGNGERQEVRGEGVVGEQPHLEPGERFEYTSGCLLRTPHGSMQGSYRMTWDGGAAFEARIAPFSLTQPNALN